MKRLFAMLLALAMILSLSVTAFAAEATGSITITNATMDQIYNIYKIFDATYSMADGAKAVSYTLDSSNQFFNAVTNTDDGKKFFVYSAETGVVTKKEGVNDSELIAYLTGLVTGEGASFTTAKDAIKATGIEVKFEGLPYGYYLITSDMGKAVTITSNTPNAEVIDKNQKPGSNFNKVIVEDTQRVAKNTAAYGDTVNYEISVDTTNYDGDKHIQYYQIIDTIGEFLAVNLDSFVVKIGNNQLQNGWLLNNTTTVGAVAEGKIGTWAGNLNDAQWYLVYLGGNRFRVTIPWQDNHIINGTTGGYTIAFPATDNAGAAINHGSLYTSPSSITLTYSATVKENAPVGGGTHEALMNKANASWTSATETGTTGEKTVQTEVFGLGILKDDSATHVNLAGAKFKIWKDKDCKEEPVNVTLSDVQGVYIHTHQGGIAQSNEAVTPVNGKIVVLGLDKGTYYLQETEAPDGYNALTAPIEIKVGEGQTPFYVISDANGNVADLRDPDGTYTVRNTYNVTHTTVGNSKGVELPSTGGEGAALLITLGAVLACAFAVLLITQKKMSIYKD